MKESYLITYQQKKLLIHEMLHPEDTAYNMLQGVRLEGELEKERLVETLRQLYTKERILRVRYEKAGSNIFQRVDETEEMNFSFEKTTRELLQERIEEEKRKPFHIFQENLTRFFLFQIDEMQYFLLIVLHHSICDGWSLKPLSEKMAALYSGKGYEIYDDYLDYAQIQNNTYSTCRNNSEFWKRELEHKECRVDFTFDTPEIFSDPILEKRIDPVISRRIRECCRAYGVTPFVFFYGCYSYLLHRYSNQEEITVAVPFANRMDRRWASTVGCFVNPFPMTYDYNHDLCIKDYLKEIFRTMVQGISKADAEIDMQCNMAFTFQNFAKVETVEVEKVHIIPVKIHNSRNKFDIELVVLEEAEEFCCSWEYAPELLSSRYMECVHRHFLNIISEILDSEEEQTISKVEMLCEHEIEKQLNQWNQNDRIYPGSTNLKECIEKAAERYSDLPALQFEKHSLTYKEFTHKTNGLIKQISEYKLQKKDVIAIQFDRGLEMVTAIYAIVRAGCAYLPIAVDTPPKRVDYILENSQARLLLKRSVAENEEYGCPILCVDFQKLPVSEESLGMAENRKYAEDGAQNIKGDDPAYVIYTSGSTGDPKGVVNTHEGICNRLYWMQEQFQLEPGDAVLQKTPYTFDVSVWEFFWPMMFGGKLVVAEPEGHKNPVYLVRTIEEEHISFIHFVPSMLNIFLKNPNTSRCNGLKSVICSGEELKAETVQRFYERLNVPLANLYGPTEAAVDVSCYSMRNFPDRSNIPIGKPIANIKLYKLDKHKRLSPYQVPGELYISGVGLAKGYLNNPQLTAEKFPQNPWEAEPYHRMYKTGDLVRYDEEGNFIYITRMDDQVKLNGQRIELQEIEERMRGYPGVEEAVVIVDKNNFGEQYLIGFAVGQQEIHSEKLLDFLREDLMEYMIPHIICQIESIPLSANGKINRRRLKEIYDSKVSTVYVPPQTPVEAVVVEEMEKVLHRKGISTNDDYFAIGGNSLRIVDFTMGLSQKLNMEIPFHLLMKHPRIKDFARQVELLGASGENEFNAEICLEQEAKAHIYVNHWELGTEEKERVIFLTGSTGFLGNYLLSDLLCEKDTDVYCLVRGEDRTAACERIIENLKTIHRWDEAYRDRIHIFLGDLGQKNMGLKEEEMEFLKEHAGLLLHNGANVNFSLPYHQIKGENVESTRTMLEILSQGRTKRMVYVSTFSIFSEEAYKKGLVSENDYPGDINNLTLGYTQSKLVSEHIIKQYADMGEAVSIVRLGRIIGDRTHLGHSDMFRLLLELCLQMNAYPRVEEYFDLLPVEIASRMIGKILLSERNAETVYHMVNQHFMTMEEIGEVIQGYSPEAVSISWEEWFEKCREEAEHGNELAKSVIVLLGKNYQGSSRKTVIMDHGKALMKEHQIEIPNNKEILNHYLNNGGRNNGNE